LQTRKHEDAAGKKRSTLGRDAQLIAIARKQKAAALFIANVKVDSRASALDDEEYKARPPRRMIHRLRAASSDNPDTRGAWWVVPREDAPREELSARQALLFLPSIDPLADSIDSPLSS